MNGLSPWMWWIAGGIMMVLEILLPGFFLLWLGLGALGTGLLAWLIPALSFQLQMVIFAVLSVVLVGIFRGMYLKQLNPPTAERLNDRTEALLGKLCTVTQTIGHGEGQVKVGDSVWKATGPDVQAGTTVRVIGVEGNTLEVVPVE